MHLLAQNTVVSFSEPAVEPEMLAVACLFSCMLILGVTFLVAKTMVAIKVASIHAKLTEKLVREGVPSEQIVNIIGSNQKRVALRSFPFGGGWKKAGGDLSKTQGKPHPL